MTQKTSEDVIVIFENAIFSC